MIDSILQFNRQFVAVHELDVTVRGFIMETATGELTEVR